MVIFMLQPLYPGIHWIRGQVSPVPGLDAVVSRNIPTTTTATAGIQTPVVQPVA